MMGSEHSCSHIQTCSTSQRKHTAQTQNHKPTGHVICLMCNHQLNTPNAPAGANEVGNVYFAASVTCYITSSHSIKTNVLAFPRHGLHWRNHLRHGHSSWNNYFCRNQENKQYIGLSILANNNAWISKCKIDSNSWTSNYSVACLRKKMRKT